MKFYERLKKLGYEGEYNINDLSEMIDDSDHIISKRNGKWILYYSPQYGTDNSYEFSSESLEDCLADCCIIILNKGLYTIEEDINVDKDL